MVVPAFARHPNNPNTKPGASEQWFLHDSVLDSCLSPAKIPEEAARADAGGGKRTRSPAKMTAPTASTKITSARKWIGLEIHTPRQNSRKPCGLSLEHLKELAGDGNRALAFDAGYALSQSRSGPLNTKFFVRRGTVQY